ncbi:MAG TPA: alpha/beta hydrolase-fold protein [Thermoanaerobaculia bacterium]|nr:alpha/beta hydrolase-fold protein [Thermoanaerobaculia bacterium]
MDTLRSTFRRALGLPNRRAAVRPGRLDRISGFESKILGNTRDVVVYVPAGYDDRRDQRHPVLYMHDGQNLFEPERAFIPGQHWRLREAADAAIGERTAAPMLIVGIDNAGVERIDEYTPDHDPKKDAGGRAEDYGWMIIEELKPMIDRGYRTSGETATGGSSLGGLVSLHLAFRHPDLFRRAAAMSPSVWWNGQSILREVDASHAPTRPRLWVDVGGREGAEALAGARALRARLEREGWNDENFRYVEDRRGDHSERAWARRVRKVLEFLFPPT